MSAATLQMGAEEYDNLVQAFEEARCKDPVERRRDNSIYLNSWAYMGEYYEAVREVVDQLQVNADSSGVYSVHIEGELVGSEKLAYRIDLTRNILFDQVVRLIDVAIKFSGLV